MADAKIDKINKLGEKGKVSKLIGFAGSRDPEERAAAATALGHNNSDDAFNTLISLLRDPDSTVQCSAALGLKEMGRPSAAEFVRHLLGSTTDEATKKACTDALATLVSKHIV